MSSAFAASIYVTALAIFVFAVAYYRFKGCPLSKSVNIAIILSFFISGAVCALESEWVWQRWIMTDLRKQFAPEFDGIEMDPVVAMNNFAAEIQTVITGHDYRLFSDYLNNAPVEFVAKKLQYCLLPSRNRKNAEYVLVYYDGRVGFDAANSLFTDTGQKAVRAEMLRKFDGDVYILRLLP